MISERLTLTLKLVGVFMASLLVKASPLSHDPMFCVVFWLFIDVSFLMLLRKNSLKEVFGHKKAWSFRLAFTVSVLSKIIIIPDLYFFFYGENPSFSIPLTAIAFLFIATVYALLYGVIFLVFSSISRKLLPLVILWLPLLNLMEVSVLYTLPLIYPFSMPIPLVNEKHREVGVRKNESIKSDIFLINPQITDSQRKSIQKLGYTAQDILGRKIADEIKSKNINLSDKVTLFLPETTFYFNPGDYLGLSKSVSAHLNKEVNIYGGSSQPGRNSVVYAGKVRRFPMGGIVYEKSDLVPFVEKETMGYSVRGEAISSQKKSKNLFLNLDKMTPIGKIFKQPRFAICYEGLMAQSWMGEQTLFLFTNQQSFHLIGILGGLFDSTLLQLAALFRKNLVLIGNFGETGLYLYHKSAVPEEVRIHSLPFQLYDGNVQGVLGSQDESLY